MWYLCVSLTEELLGFIGGDHSVLHSHQQCRRDPVSPCPHPMVLIPMAKGCGLQARASDFLATCLMTRGGQCDKELTAGFRERHPRVVRGEERTQGG